MPKFPDDARVAERDRETDEEIVRRMPVRGMLRRMMRNKGFKLVEIKPAQTPFEAIVEWASRLTAKPSHADLDDLAERLRDALALEEDGALAGNRLLVAIDSQADRTCDWKLKNMLRFLARTVEITLREMGLLGDDHPENMGFKMNEGEPSVPPSGGAARPPAVGGDLLNALDTALEAAWEDDRFVEVCAHQEGIVGALADLEFAVETLRTALGRIERPDPSEETREENE